MQVSTLIPRHRIARVLLLLTLALLAAVECGAAGVARESLLVDGCTITITHQPAAATVALGDPAIFLVEASQSALRFQWQKCHGDPASTCAPRGRGWAAIAGATATSYTTEPIQAADSGTFYRVRIDNDCALVISSAALLQVYDDTPPGVGSDPPVAVASPDGDELWPLSEPGETPHTETISWTMSDDVRICQVDLDLLFSDDGGQSYPPANRIALQTFGPGGTCYHPGVERTSFLYTLPETPPSGREGSLYKVEVTITDHAGNATVAQSAKPFYIVKPANESVKTLILWHPDRMASLGMDTSALAGALDNFAAHPRVQGRLVDLGASPELGLLYQAWDDGTKSANDVLFGTGGLHAYLRDKWLAVFTGVEYLVLVGDDRVIPLARLRDGTAGAVENLYPDGVDLTTDGTEAGKSLAANFYLSDDPLATRGSVSPGGLDDKVFLPDLAVGRLVEEPGEIVASIATFISREGVLDLTSRPHKVLVSAYDFLTDGGTKVHNRWDTVLSSGVEGGSLIGQDWTSSQLQSLVCPASDPYGVLSLNGHANHYQIGHPSAGGDPYDIVGLDTGVLASCDLSGSLVYEAGCHSGLPVADDSPTDSHVRDLPQAMLGAGALAYLSNTGYGWGLTRGVGYTERLVEIFTEELTAGPSVVLGDALRRTKLRFFLESPRFDAYDEKVSMQWTLYGFPMYALQVEAAPKASAPRRLFEGPPPRLDELTERTSFGPVGIEREALETTFADGVLLTPPPYLTRLDLSFDFSADGVYRLINADGIEDGPCTEGCYYTLNNVASGDDLATGETDRPLQPVFVYDSRLSGTSFHGFLWKGGAYIEEEDWTPVVATLQSNVDGGFADRDPLPLHSKSTGKGTVRKGTTGGACEAADTDVSSLVLEAGELLHLDGSVVERHYEAVDVELLYFNDTSDPEANCDRVGPELTAAHQVTGSTVDWTVEAADPAGVWRVLVVWNDGHVETGADGKARGRWQPLELELVDGVWQGSVQVTGSARISYFVQAVDKRGNVSLPLLQEASVPPSGVPRDFTEVVEVNLASADADLAVALTAPASVHGLETLNARLDVNNLGPDSASGAQVTADLPGMTGIYGGGLGWTCTAGTGKLVCTRAVAEPGPAPALTLGGTAPPKGRVTLTATVSALSSDAVATNDSASASVFVIAAPEADLAVVQEVTNASDGRSPVFTITVTNAGPDAVTGATVRDVLPGELMSVGWSCVPSAGAVCTAAGAGDVVDFVTIPADGWVRYTVSSVLEAGFVGSLSDTATVTAPSGVYDPALASNTSTVTLDYDSAIFADGFESGDVTAWSSAVGEVP